MACKQERILQYVEAELPKEDIAEIKKHLKTCAVCNAMVEELRPVIESLREMESPLMRPYEVLSMRQHVLAGGALSLPAAVPPPKPSRVEIASRRALPRWLEAAAVVMFGITTGLLAFAGGIAFSERLSQVNVPGVTALNKAANTHTQPDGVLPDEAIFGEPPGEPMDEERELSKFNQKQSGLRIEPSVVVPQKKKLVLDRTTRSGNRIIWNFEADPS